jgi:hypothetical protein
MSITPSPASPPTTWNTRRATTSAPARSTRRISSRSCGTPGSHPRAWGDFHARSARYNTYWAHYENNVYREVHLWSELLKDTYDLYRYTRSIFSPAYRLIEFWATHILGGSLDPLAGDGVSKPSALPIVTENEAIRAPIAQVWRDSNWQAKKEIWTRFGAAMGDSAVMVVDDPVKQKVQFRVVDPRTLRDVTRDAFGNVIAYIIEEQRPDPESRIGSGLPGYATYTEACERVGETIRYATFRNGRPYDWREYAEGDPRAGTLTEWTEDYGFVPLVFVQHRDVGLGWGWSELQPSLSKLHELDDMASKLDDWIRLTVDCPWLFTGVVPPGQSGPLNMRPSNELMVGDDDEAPKGRERIPILYANAADTRAHALVAPLDVGAVSAHVASLLASCTPTTPSCSPTTSAPTPAARPARWPGEGRGDRPPAPLGYDDAMVRAHQMAISIGARRATPASRGSRRELLARRTRPLIGRATSVRRRPGGQDRESLARARSSRR